MLRIGHFVQIAGVRIDNVTMDEAIAGIERMIQHRDPRFVVTPNVDHIVKLQHDARFRAAYDAAAMVLCDGMPLLWASRLLRTPLKEKVSGSDLFPRLCALAARKDYRLFFLGGRPGAAERCAQVLSQKFRGLNVCGTYCPPLGFESDKQENTRAIRAIRESGADVLFVGLGAPKQELWLRQNCQACAVPVSIGIGASFDFVAGYVRRAPGLFQRWGMEWFWRLCQDPRRMYRRYLVDDPEFLSLVWSQWLRTRARGAGHLPVAGHVSSNLF
jgi:N-acetylglucosaminyldiphosphoundecaprenol N-acetyl-beta-D-mannosaminyltransferase